jgi:hypothetical protein
MMTCEEGEKGGKPGFKDRSLISSISVRMTPVFLLAIQKCIDVEVG